MDEKDRVFARFKDEQPEAADRHERLTILRPARASGSRVVEVVRLRGTAAGTDRPRRVDTRVRAASWDDGFPAKRPTVAGPLVDLAAVGIAESTAPVTHVMPAWQPAPTPSAEVAPDQATEPAMALRRGRGRTRNVIPASEPAPPLEDVAPAPSVEPPMAPRRGRGRPRKETLSAPARPIADPFDADDDRANCMRCGYAIDHGRESRGLMTCAPCG